MDERAICSERQNYIYIYVVYIYMRPRSCCVIRVDFVVNCDAENKFVQILLPSVAGYYETGLNTYLS